MHKTFFLVLQEGDLVLTGTPSGVGPVKPGDQIVCGLDDPSTNTELVRIDFKAVTREKGYLYAPAQ